ncbi:MAG: hypothetical protein ACXVHX_38505, partial [Solirubrobacteraceae bacterium]
HPEPEFGEWEVRGDARAETSFHVRRGITSVVPWLVVSASGSVHVRSCAQFLWLAWVLHEGSGGVRRVGGASVVWGLVRHV